MGEQRERVLYGAKGDGADVLRAMTTFDAAVLRRARRRVTAALRAQEKAIAVAFEEALVRWQEDWIPDEPPEWHEDWYARYGGLDEEELAEVEAEEEEAWRAFENDPEDREFDPERDLPPGVFEKLQAEAKSSPAVERAARRVVCARLHWMNLIAADRLRLILGL